MAIYIKNVSGNPIDGIGDLQLPILQKDGITSSFVDSANNDFRMAINAIVDIKLENSTSLIDSDYELKDLIDSGDIKVVDFDNNELTKSESVGRVSITEAVTSRYFSFPTNTDNFDFYVDENVKFGWKSSSARLEFYMIDEPNGTGDMRSLAILDNSGSQNTYITQPNFKYNLYSTGVPSGGRLSVIISPENDENYPTYRVTLYNVGSSYNTTVFIEVIY